MEQSGAHDLPPGITAQQITVGNHLVYHFMGGHGPAVILLHGGASDSRDWLGTMTELGDRFSLYAPDIIGFGRSQRNTTGYHLVDFFDFLEDYVSTLKIKQPAIVGHSFGARVGLGLALRRPDMVRRLVLADAAGLGKVSRLGTAALKVFNLARRLLRKPPPHPTFLAHVGDDPDWACVADLPRIAAPTLIIWKRHDVYLPLANARQAARLIPDARLEIVPGYGHAPHIANAAVFRRLVGDFLAQ